MDIKKLDTPIKIELEQYECRTCKKKFYINSEDKVNTFMICPYCENQSENKRIFEIIKIESIGEY